MFNDAASGRPALTPAAAPAGVVYTPFLGSPSTTGSVYTPFNGGPPPTTAPTDDGRYVPLLVDGGGGAPAGGYRLFADGGGDGGNGPAGLPSAHDSAYSTFAGEPSAVVPPSRPPLVAPPGAVFVRPVGGSGFGELRVALGTAAGGTIGSSGSPGSVPPFGTGPSVPASSPADPGSVYTVFVDTPGVARSTGSPAVPQSHGGNSSGSSSQPQSGPYRLFDGTQGGGDGGGGDDPYRLFDGTAVAGGGGGGAGLYGVFQGAPSASESQGGQSAGAGPSGTAPGAYGAWS